MTLIRRLYSEDTDGRDADPCGSSNGECAKMLHAGIIDEVRGPGLYAVCETFDAHDAMA
jgi:hypothetical protein